MTSDDIISAIIKREGSEYTNRANDRGGPTKYGITQKTLSAWLKREATVTDVKSLAESDARAIYYALFVTEPGFAQIDPSELRAQLVDFGVNSGQRTAIKALQGILAVTPDGSLGPMTLAALKAQNWINVNNALMAARVRFLGRLIEQDRRQAENANGWMVRVTSFLVNH